jgi:prophage DNA circulation protein
MGWRDDQKEFGKLDGKKFIYENVNDSGGADGVIHRIATSGRPVYEGISEGEESFDIVARFIGEDYLVDMDDFIEILRKPKTHKFEHPYRGTFRQVALDGAYSLSNSRSNGGMCEFRFKLVVTEDQAFPLIRDASFDLLNQVGLVNLALIASYKRRFKVGTFVKQIIGTIGLATAAMRVVEGKIQAAMNLTEAFGSAVTGFADQASALLRKPGDMVTSMTSTAIGIIAGITSSVDDLPSRNKRAQNTFTQAMKEIFRQERPTAPRLATPQSLLEQENSIQWWLANRISFLSGAASAVTDMTFGSTDEVNLFKSEFLGFFDDITIDPDLDDQMYSEVRQLKANVVEYLAGVAQDLPQLTTYTTYKALPALVVGYQIYGNNDHNLEIVDRNNVVDPMFVPPRTIEVIGG